MANLADSFLADLDELSDTATMQEFSLSTMQETSCEKMVIETLSPRRSQTVHWNCTGDRTESRRCNAKTMQAWRWFWVSTDCRLQCFYSRYWEGDCCSARVYSDQHRPKFPELESSHSPPNWTRSSSRRAAMEAVEAGVFSCARNRIDNLTQLCTIVSFCNYSRIHPCVWCM